MKIIYLVNKYSPLIDIVLLVLGSSYSPRPSANALADTAAVDIVSLDPHVSPDASQPIDVLLTLLCLGVRSAISVTDM